MQRLAEYPETVATAARELAPHLLVHYLQTLAGDFHAWYNAEKSWSTKRQPNSPGSRWPMPPALRLLTDWPARRVRPGEM